MALLAAVSISFAADQVSAFYLKHRKSWKKFRLRAITVSLVALACLLFVFRFGTVYGKIMEASVYPSYATSDLKAYDAGVWLSTNFPDEATVVVTEVPGYWFSLFSGKNVIAETNPIIERNVVSESVLELSYELENPLTLIKAYEAKGDISDENYVSMNDVWRMVSYSAADGNFFISYSADGAENRTKLADFNRETVFEDQSSPKKLTIRYFNDEVNITQTILVQNDTYPINVAWTLTPVESEISDVALYLSTFFDLHFSFEKAYIPGMLNWENPWSRPSYSQDGWAVVNFSRSTLTGNYLGFYDEKEEVVFALNFNELPDWGNVGVLASRQIDAVRFQYNFDKISINQTAFFTYQILTFSQSSYPEMQQPSEVKSLFELKPSAPFEVKSRDYHDYIREENIKFIVYDKNQLDTKIIRCKLLELVYSNDRYVIFRVKSNP
jgi:hypothetical protein